MLRPLGTSSKCMTPSKFHQTHKYAFCENRWRFATGSANCPLRFNHCPCLSRFLIHIHFSSQVTIQRMKWSSRWFFTGFWHVLTLIKVRFYVNSYEASRQRLFTLAWVWRARITDVWEISSLYDILFVLVDGIFATALCMAPESNINERPWITLGWRLVSPPSNF